MENNEPIHSGHFMTSNPHSEPQQEDDEDMEIDVVDVDDTPEPLIEKRALQERAPHKIYSLQQDEKPITFYKFGPKKTQTIAIDVSLNKLNKCIKVAYMKMTTPKWKDFKGLKLQWKHRIRLNNVIWRAYYMEFRKPDKKKKTPYCYFAVPDDDNTHSKIEGTVIEGMYWKRRMEAICSQYKKWRTFNRHTNKKKKCCKKSVENSCECHEERPIRPQKSQTPQNLSTFDDYFGYDDELYNDNDFTNSLFDSLNVPFLFPNPKEMMQSNNADIMQPGLLSLQPSLEEIFSSEVQVMSAADVDANLDALEPTFSMQQPQSSNDSQLLNGRSSSYSFNNSGVPTSLNSPSKNYTSKSYEMPNIMDYNQPTRQSSSFPTNGLMTANISQPLYSQAVYEMRATPSTSSLNDSPVGSVTGIDLKPAPRSNASSISAVNSLGNALDYVPQLLVSASIGQNSQNNIHTFTSMIGQQNQNQNSQVWWMNNQQIYSPEEKALQMLRSPAAQAVNQNSNGFSTSMLLNLSQANQTIPQSSNYSNPYAFTANNFKNVQQPTLQQIAIHQQPSLPLPPDTAIQAQQLHLQLNQQRQINLQQQQQNPFQTQPNRPLSQLAMSASTQQNFNQRHDLSHYLPQNGNGVTTPSASLASILTAGPRSNSALPTSMLNQQRQDTKADSLQLNNKQSLSNTKTPNNNRQIWTNKAGIQTIASTSVGDPLSVQTNMLDSQQENPFKNTMKAPKQPTSSSSDPSSNVNGGYKRRNNRRQNPEPTDLSPPETLSTSSRRASVRSKRTRSQMLPDIPPSSTPSNSIKQNALSQPASVQTQFSYTNEADNISPLDTPQTDGIASDESFEERSPSVFSSKRARLGGACAEAADSTLNPEERKRLLHLNAEKNRREALKDGFDALVNAIPTIEETGIKVTNAVVLNRAGQHIRNLCQKIENYDQQIADCEKRHELLQKRVSIVQSSLPSNVHQAGNDQSSSSMTGQIMQFFDSYVRDRSNKDHRFFLMASMLKPVVQSFAEQIHDDNANKQQVRTSIMNWSDNNFKAARLRPLASQTLIKIATETNLMNIGSDTTPLQQYIKQEVNRLSEYNESI